MRLSQRRSAIALRSQELRQVLGQGREVDGRLREQGLELEDQVEEPLELVEVEAGALLSRAEVVDGELADRLLDGLFQAGGAVDAVVGQRGAEGLEDVEADLAERG